MSKSSTLETLIETYARAKGVTIPVGNKILPDIFSLIDAQETKKGIVDLKTVASTKPTDTAELLIMDEKFWLTPEQAFNIFRLITNPPRAVGSITIKQEGKNLHVFDELGNKVDTLYAFKNGNFESLDNALKNLGIDDEESKVNMIQCLADNFGAKCQGNKISVTIPTNWNNKTLSNGFTLLKLLKWGQKPDGKLMTVNQWLADKNRGDKFKGIFLKYADGKINTTTDDTLYLLLEKIVIELNKNETLLKQLTNYSGLESEYYRLARLSAMPYGMGLPFAFFSPWAFGRIPGFPGMIARAAGGAPINPGPVSKRLDAQLKTLQALLKENKFALDTNTEKAITNDINDIKYIEDKVKILEETMKKLLVIGDNLDKVTKDTSNTIKLDGKPVDLTGIFNATGGTPASALALASAPASTPASASAPASAIDQPKLNALFDQFNEYLKTYYNKLKRVRLALIKGFTYLVVPKGSNLAVLGTPVNPMNVPQGPIRYI